MKETFQIGTLDVEVIDIGLLFKDTYGDVQGMVVLDAETTVIRLSDQGNKAMQDFMTLLGVDYINGVKAKEGKERAEFFSSLMEETYGEDEKRGLFMKLVVDIQMLLRKLEYDGILKCYLGVSKGLSMEKQVTEGGIGETEYLLYREESEIPEGIRTIKVELGKKMIYSTKEVGKLLGF